jgi:hypothetical protein
MAWCRFRDVRARDCRLAVWDGRYVGEVVRFRLERADYVAAIEAARAGHPPPDVGTYVDVGPPTFAYFNWGGPFLDPTGIAYDETDEAGKPPELRSEAWRARHAKSEFSCGAEVRPLGGHFFMVRPDC